MNLIRNLIIFCLKVIGIWYFICLEGFCGLIVGGDGMGWFVFSFCFFELGDFDSVLLVRRGEFFFLICYFFYV